MSLPFVSAPRRPVVPTRVHADRDHGRHRDPRRARRADRAQRDLAAGRGARASPPRATSRRSCRRSSSTGSTTSGTRPAEQGLAALVAKPEQPPVPPNWKPGGYLEKLPKDPWGRPYVYLNPGRARRDRGVQLRRRRPAGRRRRRCRHRLVGPVAAPATRARSASRGRRLHADRNPGRDRRPRDRRGRRGGRLRRQRSRPRDPRSAALRRCARARRRARAGARRDARRVRGRHGWRFWRRDPDTRQLAADRRRRRARRAHAARADAPRADELRRTAIDAGTPSCRSARPAATSPSRSSLQSRDARLVLAADPLNRIAVTAVAATDP